MANVMTKSQFFLTRFLSSRQHMCSTRNNTIVDGLKILQKNANSLLSTWVLTMKPKFSLQKAPTDIPIKQMPSNQRKTSFVIFGISPNLLLEQKQQQRQKYFKQTLVSNFSTVQMDNKQTIQSFQGPSYPIYEPLHPFQSL